MRLVARLFGDRGFFAGGFADQFLGGGADLHRLLGLGFCLFAFALGFFARLALGVDARFDFDLRLALGFLARCRDLRIGFFARLALCRDACFDFRAGAVLGFLARLADYLVTRLAFRRNLGFGFGARLALDCKLFPCLGFGDGP